MTSQAQSFYMQTTPPSNNSFYIHGNDQDLAAKTSVGESELVDAGRLEEHFYDDTLQWWRAAIRRVVVDRVENESDIIAAMQERVRTPWLDTYFVYTSSLGTHTFFMIALPITFFFGYSDFGRGIIVILALGVYISSFIKDLVCSPRPFVPPVTRLTFSSHHLEYGFPSTHSTNSISIALYVYAHVQQLYVNAAICSTTFGFAVAGLLFYVFSIVYGRIYTGMHSFTDCAVGVILGASAWLMHYLLVDIMETWLATGGWIVPVTIIAISMLMVNQHPQPVDDCPCFEDAIAFVSVGMGILVGRWCAFNTGFDSSFYVVEQPGSAYDTWTNISIWWIFAIIKVTSGISLIFTWRLVTKALLHSALPPLFRFLASIFTLPNRRFYTPATDYTTVPSEKGIHPIPSVIDLPSQLELEVDDEVTTTSGRAGKKNVGVLLGRADVKNRKAGTGNVNGINGFSGYDSKSGRLTHEKVTFDDEKNGVAVAEHVKHYDADVLTKVIVYTGIGLISSDLGPIMFEMLGWGVKAT